MKEFDIAEYNKILEIRHRMQRIRFLFFCSVCIGILTIYLLTLSIHFIWLFILWGVVSSVIITLDFINIKRMVKNGNEHKQN
jgi:hypothetical protein